MPPEPGDNLLRVLSVALLLLVGLAVQAFAQTLGSAQTIDGDTLAIGGLTLRLYGVDAPEAEQTCKTAAGADWACGAAARARLSELVATGNLRCEAIERDRYGRVVGRCAAAGRDIGGALVSEGLAWAYRRYSRAYVEAETRAAGRGIWQGQAEAAWIWRRRGDRPAASAAAPEDCAIKGNVNVRGERIYHTPSSPWYDRLAVDTSKGKRWFCDAAEAEAAGWRPAAFAAGR